MPKLSKIGTIIASFSTSNFNRPQRHTNDPEARKLDVCLLVNNCLRSKEFPQRRNKKRFIRITKNAENHGKTKFQVLISLVRPNVLRNNHRSSLLNAINVFEATALTAVERKT